MNYDQGRDLPLVSWFRLDCGAFTATFWNLFLTFLTFLCSLSALNASHFPSISPPLDLITCLFLAWASQHWFVELRPVVRPTGIKSINVQRQKKSEIWSSMFCFCLTKDIFIFKPVQQVQTPLSLSFNLWFTQTYTDLTGLQCVSTVSLSNTVYPLLVIKHVSLPS